MNDILPYLEDIFKHFHDNVLSSKILSTFFKSDDQIKFLIEKQKANIEAYFTETEAQLKHRYEKLGEIHYKINVPLVNVLAELDFMKNELFSRLIRDCKMDQNFLSLTKYFDLMKNHIAKGYMNSSLENYFTDIKTDETKDYFFKELTHWMHKFNEALKKEEESLFPEFDSEQCDLRKWFLTREFRLVCGNDKTMNAIRNIHESLHNTAKSIAHYVMNKQYVESALLIDVFLTLYYRLVGEVRNIYLNYLNNTEDYFFQFIEDEIKTGNINYITIVSIKKWKVINDILGKSAEKNIPETVEKSLNDIAVDYDPDAFVIKGIFDDFYIFFKNIKKEALKEFQHEANNKLNTLESEISGIKTGITVVTAEISRNKAISKEDIRRIADFIREKIKKSDEAIIFIEKETIERDILPNRVKKYNDAKFIIDAISTRKIDVFFQPICDAVTKDMHHVEALARLKHEDKIISAGAFIDLIYDMGLITELDTHVLDKILSYKDELKKVTRRIFINMSPESIKSGAFLAHLLTGIEALKSSGLEVIIELTEQAFLKNIEIISCLHETFDIVFAVDDFGTGYSSLKTVLDLSERGTISYLKIDGSLIKDIDNSRNLSKIVQTIALMSVHMALKNIAEFVENEQILKELEHIGIQYAQGFYLSMPLPIDELVLKYQTG